MLDDLLKLFKGLIGKVAKTKPGSAQQKELMEIGEELKKMIETTAAGTSKIDSQIDGLKQIEKLIADAEARNVVAKSDVQKLEEVVIKDMEDSFKEGRPQKSIEELQEQVANEKVVDIKSGKPVEESLGNIKDDLGTILDSKKERNKILSDAVDEVLAPAATKIKRHPTVTEISKRIGKTEDEVEELIMDYLNEGYEAGSPKRMQYGDTERLGHFLDVTDKRPGGTSGLMSEIEEFDIMSDVKASVNEQVGKIADERAVKESRTTAYETETIKTLAANKLKIQELRAAGKNEEADALLKVTEDAVEAIRSEEIGPNELLDIFPFDPNKPKHAKGGRVKYAEGDPEGVQSMYEMTQKERARWMEKLERMKRARLMQMEQDDPSALMKNLSYIDPTGILGGKISDKEMSKMETRFLYDDHIQKMKLGAAKDMFDKKLKDVEKQIRESQKPKMFEAKAGGRVKYAEGDPEGVDNKKGVTRRNFLKGAGGLGMLAMIPGFLKKAMVGKTAATTAKAIPVVEGMPNWFPALVNTIRTKGKVVRKPDYKDFTSGGDTEAKYVLEDKSLPEGRIVMYEDEATGAVSISGRGDEFQQATLDYYPGENQVRTNQLGQRGVVTEKPTFDASAQTQAAARAEERGGFLGNKDITDELMGQHSVKVNDKGTFEAGEFAKGEFRDVENFGGIDDMRGGLTSWEKLATGTDDQLKKVAEEFKKMQKNPNIIDDMAEGGRVGYGNGGGVGTLFRRRV